jgi:hypothetical protein
MLFARELSRTLNSLLSSLRQPDLPTLFPAELGLRRGCAQGSIGGGCRHRGDTVVMMEWGSYGFCLQLIESRS